MAKGIESSEIVNGDDIRGIIRVVEAIGTDRQGERIEDEIEGLRYIIRSCQADMRYAKGASAEAVIRERSEIRIASAKAAMEIVRSIAAHV